MNVNKARNLYGVAGFGLATGFAVVQGWSLPEFAWSTWLAGLVYAWACILTAFLHIVLTARPHKPAYDERLPFLRRIPTHFFIPVMAVVSVIAAFLAYRIYSFVFGFYGLFLSVFAEMEPHALFGRNGFINSDFWTPVIHLLDRFWPMAAGVLVSNGVDFFGPDPWRRILLPAQKEVLRMHAMILALPIFSMIAWFLFGGDYQSMTIVLLMALFYLLPKKGRAESQEETQERWIKK